MPAKVKIIKPEVKVLDLKYKKHKTVELKFKASLTREEIKNYLKTKDSNKMMFTIQYSGKPAILWKRFIWQL